MNPPSPDSRRSPFSAGWILVVAVMALCVAGTWMTAHIYRSRVFSSKTATVLGNEWPEPRISVEFNPEQARLVIPGMAARITVGSDPAVLTGVVVSSDSSVRPSVAIIRLLPGESVKDQRPLPAGAACSVTIDTTVPLRAEPQGSRSR